MSTSIISSPVNESIKEPKYKVLIYTPSYDLKHPIDLFAQYISVMNLQTKYNTHLDFVLPSNEDVKARGLELGMDIISGTDHGFTHNFNWDSNYVFEPEALFNLLESNYDIIGLSTPSRGLRTEFLSELSSGDPKSASFVLNYHLKLPEKDISIKNGLTEVEGLNIGCMLTSTSFIKKLQEDFTDTHVSLFGPYVKDEKLHFGEDGFFQKARDKGFTIMGCLKYSVGLNSPYLFTGCHLESLVYGNEKFGKKDQDDSDKVNDSTNNETPTTSEPVTNSEPTPKPTKSTGKRKNKKNNAN